MALRVPGKTRLTLMDLPTLDKLEMSDATVGRLNEAVKYLENMVKVPEVSVVLCWLQNLVLHSI